MWSGSKALSNIDQTLQTIRNEVVRLDERMSSLSQSLAQNKRQRIKIINDIATVRLSEIEQGGIQQSLTAADHQALGLLEQREEVIERLNQSIEVDNQTLQQAESDREQLLAQVNQISQQLVDVEASVQAQLKQDKTYLEQLARASEAESIAVEANQKAEQAQQNLAAKAKPYQADKLFMYLWQRGFGTTEYKGGLFGRFMDGRVARLIDYEPARANYWNLTEIPKRLGSHAEWVTKVAGEQRLQLEELELAALEKAGAKKLEQQLEDLRQKLDAFDDKLEQQEQQLNSKLTERTQFIAGQDPYLQKCIQHLAEALQHSDLQSVHRYVRATSSPTDDQLVMDLQSVAVQNNELDAGLADVRALYDKQIGRLKELEKVRRDFKNSRFDDVRSGFGNESLLAGVLGQFLQGIVSGSDLWTVIKRNQRYRDVGSLPDFGSGGLGDLADILGSGNVGRRRRRRSTWHWPKPRRGGGGFNFPSRPSGGGGFKTGGGF